MGPEREGIHHAATSAMIIIGTHQTGSAFSAPTRGRVYLESIISCHALLLMIQSVLSAVYVSMGTTHQGSVLLIMMLHALLVTSTFSLVQTLHGMGLGASCGNARVISG
jgi:hypothetical protein